MTRIKTILGILAIMGLPMISHTSQMSAQDKLFTLEDLNYGGTNYRKMLPENRQLTWWGDQLIYQDAEEGGTIDNKQQKKTLFTLKEVNTALKTIKGCEEQTLYSAMNASYPYPEQPLVLLNNAQCQLLYNFKTKQVEWAQPTAHATLKKWNKISKALAFKKADHQLYVLADGEEQQLTTDGSREIVYGEAVHRNEFGIMEGLFWSPDGQRLAFYRMDQSMVTDYPQVDIFPRSATYEPDKYPMAGMTSHQVTVGVYDLKTKQTVYLQAGDPTDRYFTNIAWSPDGQTVYMQELNRGQNDCRLVSYHAATGEKIAELYRETSDKYVEPQHPIVFLPWDSSKFIMQSQKDGYNHLYLFDTKGKELKQLTKGPWVVTKLLGFNKKQKSVIIISNEKHPLQTNAYAVNINTGKRTLLDAGIKVSGVVSDADLARYYSESDALVSFSQWELFNLPLAEAGFARTPALALNVCAHPEVTPFVFDSYEAVRDYLLQSTRQSLHSDGEKMHAYVSGRFRWEQNVQGLLEVFKSVVPEPSAKKPSFIKNLIWLFWEARESLRQNIYRKWVKRR